MYKQIKGKAFGGKKDGDHNKWEFIKIIIHITKCISHMIIEYFL